MQGLECLFHELFLYWTWAPRSDTNLMCDIHLPVTHTWFSKIKYDFILKLHNTLLHVCVCDPLLYPNFASYLFSQQLSWLLTKWGICVTQVTITIYQIVFPCSLRQGSFSHIRPVIGPIIKLQAFPRCAPLNGASEDRLLCLTACTRQSVLSHTHTHTKAICGIY